MLFSLLYILLMYKVCWSWLLFDVLGTLPLFSEKKSTFDIY